MKKYYLLYLIISSFLVKLNSQSIELELFSKSEVAMPVEIANAGDDRLFIVNQNGRIFILNNDGSVNSTPFLDITDRVPFKESQHGLLGLAFPSDYNSSGKFFVCYIGEVNSKESTIISRFKVTSNVNVADAGSEQIVFFFEQTIPGLDHKAGCIKFGPDGYLYIAAGDGGKSTHGVNAVDLSKDMGKILRIDVSGDTFSSPSDNPFSNDASALNEIWAYGVRNPWKISFDRQTGDFWIADVGDDKYDEINFQSATSKGGENYGWPCYEASIVGQFAPTDCPDINSTTVPVETYFQDKPATKVAVTGGFVYRGNKYPYFNGYYIYAEAYTGYIFGVYEENNEWKQIPLGQVEEFIVSFGEDKDGELYASTYYVPGYDEVGNEIYKVKLNAPTGIRKISGIDNYINVYPNPSENILTVYPEYQNLKYYITSESGMLLKTGTIDNNNQVNISEIPSGFYILKLTDYKNNYVGISKFQKL